MYYLALSFLSGLGFTAQNDVTELRHKAAVSEFAGYVAETAEAMHLDGKVGIGTTDENLNGDPRIPTAIGLVPNGDPLRERVKYILYIRNDYLLEHPVHGLRHAAVHEVCHVAMGHVLNPDKTEEEEWQEEYQTEKCAYLYMGEDRFAAYMRAEAVREGNRPEIVAMTDAELLNLIRTSFGYDAEPQ